MYKQIFPAEIVQHTAEYQYAKNDKPFIYIYLSLMLLLLGFIIVLPLIHIDITTQGRGIIKTRLESSSIQTGTYGLVEHCWLREGQKVFKGDTLLILNTDNIKEQINHITKSIADNKIFINDLSKLILNKQKLQSPKYRQEFIQFQAKVQEYDIKLKLLKKDFAMSEHLFNEEVIAEMEFLQKKSAYETLLAEKKLFERQKINQWQAEKTNLEFENKELASNLTKQVKNEKQYVVTAPTTGTIFQTKGIQSGSFLSPGQVIAQISPDEEIIAECYISPSDIGFINMDQGVSFQIDAFNYNQWGLIEGKVIGISEDIISIDNSPVFKIQCQLAAKNLQLKSGHKGYLKKGMTLTGRFFLNERTLYQLLYDKMDDWLNPNLAKLKPIKGLA
ncbi:HlyD family secretion protein [Saccharicrinis carchari]|uniref:HlyD family secretion protein n=1 Tax=Saccharicrinis carchari TaxID=1168039 RepID=A0A521CKA6_SACCC|nr:HlyD family efflux transporter periplasmic adaptor subunit [Saccharicrinis carchari]SMO59852.1 HlyD family secretion protein [Saccharicrinis carchari]